MIAQPEWFNLRKYGGWGVTPRSWQGWVYIIGIFVPLVIFLSLPDLDSQVRTAGTVLWLVFVALDLLPIIVTMKKDEREYKNEAVAERNASWFMVAVLMIGILYELVISGLSHEFSLNWFMILALFGGAIVKGASHYHMDKNGC